MKHSWLFHECLLQQNKNNSSKWNHRTPSYTSSHQTPYAYVGIADIPYIIFYTRISKTDSAKTKQKKELLRQKAIQLSKKFIYEHCEYKVFDRLKGKEVAHHEKNFNELENWSIYPTKIKDKDELMESLKFLMMLFHDYLTKEVSKTKKDFN